MRQQKRKKREGEVNFPFFIFTEDNLHPNITFSCKYESYTFDLHYLYPSKETLV